MRGLRWPNWSWTEPAVATSTLRLAPVLAPVAVLAGLGLLTACGPAGTASPTSPASFASGPATAATSAASGHRWVDQPVSFQAGGLTVYATFRHPATATATVTATSRVPAVLLIAGSGPTDRNGNSALFAGPLGTLQAVAGWLSAAEPVGSCFRT